MVIEDRMKQIWIGYKYPVREIFRPDTTPTEIKYRHLYNACIGPFRTLRAAKYMLKYGQNNPHLFTVNDAERLSKNDK